MPVMRWPRPERDRPAWTPPLTAETEVLVEHEDDEVNMAWMKLWVKDYEWELLRQLLAERSGQAEKEREAKEHKRKIERVRNDISRSRQQKSNS